MSGLPLRGGCADLLLNRRGLANSRGRAVTVANVNLSANWSDNRTPGCEAAYASARCEQLCCYMYSICPHYLVCSELLVLDGISSAH